MVVLVYRPSALIFIKLWGQMQSDTMALLWKGGGPQHPGEREPCFWNESPSLRPTNRDEKPGLRPRESRLSLTRLMETPPPHPRAQRLMETSSAVITYCIGGRDGEKDAQDFSHVPTLRRKRHHRAKTRVGEGFSSNPPIVSTPLLQPDRGRMAPQCFSIHRLQVPQLP